MDATVVNQITTTTCSAIVDGQAKREFTNQDVAIQVAKDLKTRFPSLQIKVYDAETGRAEQIELAPA